MDEDNHPDDPPTEPRRAVFHTRYSGDERPTEAVLRALSAVEGVEPTEIDPPLYETVDPDALDRLLGDPVVGDPGGVVVVRFCVSGYRVVIKNNGEVTIFETENDA
jgi:hypothetical protein